MCLDGVNTQLRVKPVPGVTQLRHAFDHENKQFGGFFTATWNNTLNSSCRELFPQYHGIKASFCEGRAGGRQPLGGMTALWAVWPGDNRNTAFGQRRLEGIGK